MIAYALLFIVIYKRFETKWGKKTGRDREKEIIITIVKKKKGIGLEIVMRNTNVTEAEANNVVKR